MNPDEWRQIKHFTPDEAWGDPQRMDSRLIFLLEALRRHVGVPIRVHCGFEPRDGQGYHPVGKAADVHAVGIALIEFYIAAARFDFTGIGIYPWWTHPGLHLDTRPVVELGSRSIWGSTGPKTYVPFNEHFLDQVLRMKKPPCD